MVIFNGVNFVLLCLIGLLHIYWAFGGTWGLAGAVPETTTGEVATKPGAGLTLLVAVALFVGALLHIGSTNLLPSLYRQIGLLGMSLVFLLRVIGDFNYVGVFKKKKHTIFAKRDQLFYIPLCALLSVNAFLAAGVFSFS